MVERVENVGAVDAALRIILGTVFILSIVFNTFHQHQTLLGGLGIYLIITGAIKICWFYELINFDTTRSEKNIVDLDKLKNRK